MKNITFYAVAGIATIIILFLTVNVNPYLVSVGVFCLMLALLLWQPRSEYRMVQKGEHYFTPVPIQVFYGTKFKKTVTLGPTMKYLMQTDSEGVNRQKHWSKLTGINFTPWKNKHNVMMVGFFYNPDTRVFHLTPYWHSNGGRVWDDRHFLVPESFTGEIDIEFIMDRDTIYVEISTVEFSEQWIIPFPEQSKLFFEQPSFFGGRQPSPTDLFFYIKNR